MTGKTHKKGGMLCAMVGFVILRENGLLYGNINPILQLVIMYPFAIWGSICSDLDHHWSSCPDKSIPSRVINWILHLAKPLEDNLNKTGSSKSPQIKLVCTLFNAKHRSWQTHSDLTLYCALLLLKHILDGNLGNWILTKQDIILASLIVTGITMGIIAHFIYDMLTPEGIWIIGFCLINKALKKKVLPEKLHFVPKTKFFATGGSWETFIRKLSGVATWVLAVYIVLTTINPNIFKSLISMIPFELSVG